MRDINGALVANGNLLNQRSGAKAIVLTDGNIMLIGGINVPSSWEIYTPAGSRVSTGSLTQLRDGGSGAVKISNGNIFIFGASSGGGSGTWEIRDQSGNFIGTGNLNTAEGGATAAVQSTGNVMIVGGGTFPNVWQSYTATGAFVSSGSLADNRAAGHSQTHF